MMYQVYSQLRVYRSGGEFPNREFPRSGIDGNSRFGKSLFENCVFWEFLGIPIQGSYIGFAGGELELELIQTQMAQKPMLRA